MTENQTDLQPTKEGPPGGGGGREGGGEKKEGETPYPSRPPTFLYLPWDFHVASSFGGPTLFLNSKLPLSLFLHRHLPLFFPFSFPSLFFFFGNSPFKLKKESPWVTGPVTAWCESVTMDDGKAASSLGTRENGEPLFRHVYAKTQKALLDKLHQNIECYRDVELTEDSRMTLGRVAGSLAHRVQGGYGAARYARGLPPLHRILHQAAAGRQAGLPSSPSRTSSGCTAV